MPTAPKEAIFSIIQTGDDDAIGPIESLLAGQPRITAVVTDSGRWYATPDRDDLPEWFALRVYCEASLVDDVMKDVASLILDRLGEAVLRKVSIKPFSS